MIKAISLALIFDLIGCELLLGMIESRYCKRVENGDIRYNIDLSIIEWHDRQLFDLGNLLLHSFRFICQSSLIVWFGCATLNYS